MFSIKNRAIYIFLLVLIMSLAGCSALTGATGGNDDPPVEDAPVEDSPAEPETDAGETDMAEGEGEAKEDPVIEDEPEEVEVTEEPTPVPTAEPIPDFITKDNAGDIVQLASRNEDKTALTAIAYSPVEDLVATFGWSKKINIFDGETGNLVRTITGSSEWGTALAFSPDGSKIAVGSGYAYRFWVWDVTTGQLDFEVITNSWVRRVAWSSDGSHLAVAGQSQSSVPVFDSSSGAEVSSLPVTSGESLSVAYSEEYIAVGNDTGIVSIYNADNFSSVRDLARIYSEGIDDVEFSPDGQYLAVVYGKSGIVIYNIKNDWSQVSTLLGHGSNFDAAFSKGGDVLFTTGEDGMLIAWDVESGAKLFSKSFSKVVWSVSVSGTGKKLAVALDDGTMVILGLSE